MIKQFLFFLAAVFISLSIGAQTPPPGQYTSTNKKAIKYIEEGRGYFEAKKDEQAEKYFKKALEEDPKFVEACLGLASLYQVSDRHEDAVVYLKKAIELNPKFFPNSFYLLAQSQMMLGQYPEAKTNLEAFLKIERINPNTKERAEKLMVNAVFGTEAIKKPFPFNPINVGKGINTEDNEYFPAITADGSEFIFTRGLKVPEMPGYENEDFFSSYRLNSIWQIAQPLREINSMGNEGAPTLSADGSIMFFASCANEFGDYGAQGRQGYGSCDIFYAQKINGRWTKPRNAGSSINTNHWETQPSFSSDGKTLYFIRGIVGRGGIKDQDIYMSTIDNGKFMPAVKISTNVNTPMKEESVFIHPDNQTLYFSSEGHPGMGGLDNYLSKRQPNGEWGPAINLGYPLNSFVDDNSLVVGPDGKIAFFASNRKGGFGGLDIYQFELPESARPEKMTFAKGKVYNAKTKAPLEANFELFDLETGLNLTRSTSGSNGEFFVTLNSNKNYLVNVNKDGYLFYSENFSLKDKVADFEKPFLLDIPLEPIDTGSTVELKNVFFDVNKWELKTESKAELDKLASFLAKNPTLHIELGGHTDNSGDKKFNATLSANRAKAVQDYLITKGKIEEGRLTYHGYADKKPKVPNDSPENKARNRRTEFKVTSK
ncbi:MAG: PD40 domain-containing protein [Bacteroidetes bacterium]|nr:PD40 domain-containing protein [Bacteroidota bacterium]